MRYNIHQMTESAYHMLRITPMVYIVVETSQETSTNIHMEQFKTYDALLDSV
jgi:hypothetical protein